MEEFSIYRPPTTSGKLEGTYYLEPDDVWKPSLSYKHRLEDIRDQFTPAEYYRYTLETSGKQIRIIQRLERRWNKNYDGFVKAAIVIQALYRGNVGREYFESVRGELKEQYRRREALAACVVFFENLQYAEAIAVVDEISPMPVNLLAIKMRCYYQLVDYKACIAVSTIILGNCCGWCDLYFSRLTLLGTDIEPLNEEAYYIQSCSHAKLKNYDEAYQTLKLLMIQVEEPASDAFRLFGFVAVQMTPKLFEEAKDSFDVLVRRDNSDYDAVCVLLIAADGSCVVFWSSLQYFQLLQRASCNCCLQEWRLVIKDLSYILVFKPMHVPALLLRYDSMYFLSCTTFD